ncbi:MAG: exonuclease SbcCD subunit D C-terminal domain-containing protein, partial [Duodenibacillus sp.]|nr:exonuclease SbcCD subunit D C-terminal domain-containing protein [Duodenibacillus sp.]
PNVSRKQFYDFLVQARTQPQAQPPCRHIVVTAGNHDSASFLDAPADLCAALNVKIVGSPGAEPSDEVLELKDAADRTEAVVCAVPFLRERDLYALGADDGIESRDALIIEGVRKHYKLAAQRAFEIRDALAAEGRAVPVIAMGHLFAAGAGVETYGAQDAEVLSTYVGGLGKVPADVFDERFDYVALGHVHSPQVVGGRDAVRYCGSPVQTSFADEAPEKCVLVVDWKPGEPVRVERVPVPAFDRLVRVRGGLEAIEERLRELASEGEPAFCEVLYEGGSRVAGLCERVREAAKGGELTIVSVMDLGSQEAVYQGEDGDIRLHELTPAQMFEKRLEIEQGRISDEEAAALRRCHEEILRDIEAGEQKEGKA